MARERKVDIEASSHSIAKTSDHPSALTGATSPGRTHPILSLGQDRTRDLAMKSSFIEDEATYLGHGAQQHPLGYGQPSEQARARWALLKALANGSGRSSSPGTEVEPTSLVQQQQIPAVQRTPRNQYERNKNSSLPPSVSKGIRPLLLPQKVLDDQTNLQGQREPRSPSSQIDSHSHVSSEKQALTLQSTHDPEISPILLPSTVLSPELSETLSSAVKPMAEPLAAKSQPDYSLPHDYPPLTQQPRSNTPQQGYSKDGHTNAVYSDSVNKAPSSYSPMKVILLPLSQKKIGSPLRSSEADKQAVLPRVQLQASPKSTPSVGVSSGGGWQRPVLSTPLSQNPLNSAPLAQSSFASAAPPQRVALHVSQPQLPHPISSSQQMPHSPMTREYQGSSQQQGQIKRLQEPASQLSRQSLAVPHTERAQVVGTQWTNPSTVAIQIPVSSTRQPRMLLSDMPVAIAQKQNHGSLSRTEVRAQTSGIHQQRPPTTTSRNQWQPPITHPSQTFLSKPPAGTTPQQVFPPPSFTGTPSQNPPPRPLVACDEHQPRFQTSQPPAQSLHVSSVVNLKPSSLSPAHQTPRNSFPSSQAQSFRKPAAQSHQLLPLNQPRQPSESHAKPHNIQGIIKQNDPVPQSTPGSHVSMQTQFIPPSARMSPQQTSSYPTRTSGHRSTISPPPSFQRQGSFEEPHQNAPVNAPSLSINQIAQQLPLDLNSSQVAPGRGSKPAVPPAQSTPQEQGNRNPRTESSNEQRHSRISLEPEDTPCHARANRRESLQGASSIHSLQSEDRTLNTVGLPAVLQSPSLLPLSKPSTSQPSNQEQSNPRVPISRTTSDISVAHRRSSSPPLQSPNPQSVSDTQIPTHLTKEELVASLVNSKIPEELLSAEYTTELVDRKNTVLFLVKSK